MSFFSVKNIRIAGMSAAVPKGFVLANGESSTVTGIKKMHKSESLCLSDLCFAASEKLLSDLGWNKSDIEALVLVTQSPDYPLPATACILQHRLGLGKDCAAWDISLGCSGWVYGLSSLAAFMDAGKIKKAILLCGDSSRSVNPKDKSSSQIFGDAGTCTALELCPDKNDVWDFSLHTDGSGYRDIIIPEGGTRHPFSAESLVEKDFGDGIIRKGTDVVMDGMNIFAFGISAVPRCINALCGRIGIDKSSVSYLVLHQANKAMLEKIRKKTGFSEAQVPYSLDDYGNTSSASIPITMVARCAERLQGADSDVVACGFGVGLSWGAVHLRMGNMTVPPVIELDEEYSDGKL